jgi:hypothetical protein
VEATGLEELVASLADSAAGAGSLGVLTGSPEVPAANFLSDAIQSQPGCVCCWRAVLHGLALGLNAGRSPLLNLVAADPAPAFHDGWTDEPVDQAAPGAANELFLHVEVAAGVILGAANGLTVELGATRAAKGFPLQRGVGANGLDVEMRADLVANGLLVAFPNCVVDLAKGLKVDAVNGFFGDGARGGLAVLLLDPEPNMVPAPKVKAGLNPLELELSKQFVGLVSTRPPEVAAPLLKQVVDVVSALVVAPKANPPPLTVWWLQPNAGALDPLPPNSDVVCCGAENSDLLGPKSAADDGCVLWNSGRLGGNGGVHLEADEVWPLRAKHCCVLATRPKGSDASSCHDTGDLPNGERVLPVNVRATEEPKPPEPAGFPKLKAPLEGAAKPLAEPKVAMSVETSKL